MSSLSLDLEPQLAKLAPLLECLHFFAHFLLTADTPPKELDFEGDDDDSLAVLRLPAAVPSGVGVISADRGFRGTFAGSSLLGAVATGPETRTLLPGIGTTPLLGTFSGGAPRGTGERRNRPGSAG